jgi:acetylornithine deacetylase/succinyl-diaminopimelate desuccinylase-like protein
MEEAKFMANLSGAEMYKKYHMCDCVNPMHHDKLEEMYLNNVWRANLAITGAGGLPDIAIAGNVIRSSTTVRLSCRLSPIQDPVQISKIIVEKLTKDVPHNCKVTVKQGGQGYGWCKKEYQPWLDEAIAKAGAEFYDGKKTGSYGMGGSIPFLAELEKMYP